MNVSPARTAAFDVLYRIETDNAFSSVLLPQYEEKLSIKDKALCHEIVLGVLRRQIYLDRLIDRFAAKPKIDIEVRLALRIGIFQLLYLDKVPPYSAVNESVNLASRAKKSSAKGMVNAVLRRVQREQVDIIYQNDIERISVETSHPQWLVQKWNAEFGLSETEKLTLSNNCIPPAAFRLTKSSRNKGLKAANRWRESEFVTGCFFADRIDLNLLRLAETGDVYFQDEASQMVASSVALEPNATFLDVCAAPGGKTTLIASRTDQGNLLAAGDLHWHRVKLLKDNCERQGVRASVVQYDAESELPFAEESFDAVLIDAPCSGTGTIRHNPEIRYSLEPEDFDELSVKQLRILETASKTVRPGGRIYYSTCSMEIEENERVISRFLEGNGEFKMSEPNVGRRFRTEEGFGRTFPHRDNMDGFFLAVLTREGKGR
jgi:16S rRNA (cytosine967-C5)-methyltransferase